MDVVPRTAAVTCNAWELRQLLRLWAEVVRFFENAAELPRSLRADVRSIDSRIRGLLPAMSALPLDGWWSVSAAQLREVASLVTSVRRRARGLGKTDAIGVYMRCRDINGILVKNLQLELPFAGGPGTGR